MATQFFRRPGAKLADIIEKRQALIEKLESAEHEGTVVTRKYGLHDPRIAPFPPCSCGAPGQLQLLPSKRWIASCTSCSNAIADPQKHDWAACLRWCQLHLDQLDYKTLPLFDLQELDRESAHLRMVAIYDDLNLRCQIATLDLQISQRTHDHPAPGRNFYDRLCAYRDWAKLAIRMIKASGVSRE